LDIAASVETTARLSFEHVPPRKAFNDQPILLANVERLRSGGHPGECVKDGWNSSGERGHIRSVSAVITIPEAGTVQPT
jgi:hypothetical protein